MSKSNDIFCSNCGMKMDTNSKFCIKCGMKIQETLNTKTNNIIKKKNKVPLIIGIIVATILLVVAGAFGVIRLLKSNNPVNKVIENIRNGKYETAKEIYASDIDNDSDKSVELREKLEMYISECKEDYYNEIISYEEMKNIIEIIEYFDINKLAEEITELKTYVNKINTSRTAFNIAEEFMQKGNYKEAINNYALVIPEDKYYETSRTKKQEAVDSYRQYVLTEAETCASKGDYLTAVSLLDSALEIIENDTSIETQINMYKEEQMASIIEDAKSKAEEFRAEQKYIEAIQTLENVLDYDDMYIETLYSSIFDEFLQNVLNEAKEEFNSSGHTAAVSKLNEYNSYFSNEMEFVEVKEYYNNLAPDMLTDIEPFEEWNWEGTTSYAVDKLGNEYGTCFVIDDSKNSSNYAEFYLNSSYVSISGVLACSENVDAKDIGRVDIYADDELIYSSPTIATKTEPIEFNLNIEGTNYLLIDVIALDNKMHNYSTEIIIEDVVLNKY